MSSMAAEALREASSSLAALAARSNPSGSKPVTEDPPPPPPVRPPPDEGALSGVIAAARLDGLSSFLRLPPNMLLLVLFGWLRLFGPWTRGIAGRTGNAENGRMKMRPARPAP